MKSLFFLSILTIFRDNCQTKSVEDKNRFDYETVLQFCSTSQHFFTFFFFSRKKTKDKVKIFYLVLMYLQFYILQLTSLSSQFQTEPTQSQ